MIVSLSTVSCRAMLFIMARSLVIMHIISLASRLHVYFRSSYESTFVPSKVVAYVYSI